MSKVEIIPKAGARCNDIIFHVRLLVAKVMHQNIETLDACHRIFNENAYTAHGLVLSFLLAGQFWMRFFLAFAWFFMRYFNIFTEIIVQNALIAQVWQDMEVFKSGMFRWKLRFEHRAILFVT